MVLHHVIIQVKFARTNIFFYESSDGRWARTKNPAEGRLAGSGLDSDRAGRIAPAAGTFTQPKSTSLAEIHAAEVHLPGRAPRPRITSSCAPSGPHDPRGHGARSIPTTSAVMPAGATAVPVAWGAGPDPPPRPPGPAAAPGPGPPAAARASDRPGEPSTGTSAAEAGFVRCFEVAIDHLRDGPRWPPGAPPGPWVGRTAWGRPRAADRPSEPSGAPVGAIASRPRGIRRSRQAGAFLNQLGRRNLTDDQRAVIAKQIKDQRR
jgi:hypothetical protein